MSTGAATLRHVLPSTHRLEKRSHGGWIMPRCATLQVPLHPMRSWVVKIRSFDIFQSSPCYSHGVGYIGLPKSPFNSKKDSMYLDAISSKNKHGQVRNAKDLDIDDNSSVEADLKYMPRGFGQGKTYDISVEDKLLEQIECNKTVALLKQKTKAASKEPKSKSDHPTMIDGIKVWVGGLPKKRNIDRDLWSAFRHVPGLLHISPGVIGREKTRDPICKGFGFLTFDTLEHAKSFISSFQGQFVNFGKVEKQLNFSITKASTDGAVPSGSKRSFEVSKLRVRDKDGATETGSHIRPEVGSPRLEKQDTTVDATQEREPVQLEVIQNELDASSFEEDNEFLGEDESDNELISDDESEIEASVDMGDLSAAIVSRPQEVEDKKLREAERHIEELEERLRKNLESGTLESQKKSEKKLTKPRGFNSKRLSSKRNNLAMITHGLKKREREVMTGVFEKYGKGPSPTKP